MKIALPDVVSRESSLSEMEWFLIRSIEWTTFQEETYRDALEQANAIFRYFLGPLLTLCFCCRDSHTMFHF